MCLLLPVFSLQHPIRRDHVGSAVFSILQVCAVVQPELGADYVLLRWYFGHVEPKPLPTFMSNPRDVMIYFKLQVCDQRS